MKILFLGDYSNLHACLASDLRKKGHDVTVLSDGGRYLKTDADYLITRQPGLRGSLRYLIQLFSVLPHLKGYDVVQVINPNFLDLRPGKIKYFFDRIRRQNGKCYLTLCNNDYYYVKACAEGKLLRYSDFKVGDKLTEYSKVSPEKLNGWFDKENSAWNPYFYEQLDGAMAVLPEYDIAARPILGDKVTFTNLPVDLSYLPFAPLEINGPLRILIGIRQGMEIKKGTAYMLSIAKELEREMPGKVTVDCVRSLPLKEYLKHMADSHLVLDQLYAYSPATNALQAMAMGRVAGSGAQPEYYDFIDHNSSQPIFSLSPLDPVPLKERLRELILDPSPLVEMGREGRKIVEKHNDVSIVADRFLNVWQK